VNLATFWQFTVIARLDHKRRLFHDVVMPLIGFVFCVRIWLGLKTPAKIVGGVWFLNGLVYCALKMHGFHTRPLMIDFSES
jgi:hypothetical protein